MEEFTRVKSTHPLGHKLLQMHFIIQETPKCSLVPLDTLTIFTAASRRTGWSVIIQQHISSWWQLNIQIKNSPQNIKLAAEVRVLQNWSSPITIVTDSSCVTGIVTRIEESYLRDISKEQLIMLLYTLSRLVKSQWEPLLITHIQSHNSLPGPLVERNRTLRHCKSLTTLA